jgi:uncharacterized protein YqjF (DUF2071 family)
MPDAIAPSFLTAEWRFLAMLNWEVERAFLHPFVPAGTELDDWNGRVYASVVGFLFRKTRVLGIPAPFHGEFEEVNLRFYVRRKTREGIRRGVVFVKELVPRRLVALIARRVLRPALASALGRNPDVAFLAAGSAVRVRRERKVDP